MAMDVDEEQHGNGNAYPSPELIASPITATNGPEKGTQIEKVADLTDKTTFLDLADDSPSSSKNPVLLQCEFNPHDPVLLAAAGTDALARMWNISRVTPDVDVQMNRDSVSPFYSSLLDEGVSSKTTAALISWAPDGSCIAVASEPVDSEAARVEVWTKDNTSVASFESFYPSIIALLWNPANSHLLTLSPTPPAGPEQRQGTLIRVLTVATLGSADYYLPNHDLLEHTLDATWTGSEEFVLCGGDVLQAYTFVDGIITASRKYETRDRHGLSKVTFDQPSGLLATGSDTGIIDVSSLPPLTDIY
jgi:transducin (beta)-like 1